MEYVDTESSGVLVGEGGAGAPAIYVIGSTEHPFDVDALARVRACTVVKVPVRDWNSSLTPWPAPGLYRGESDFAGNAPTTLFELLGVIPEIERRHNLQPIKRAICGYSLGGLFALYAFAHSEAFSACTSLSGSVWYEGWVEHLRTLEFDGSGRFAFLSVGSKEKHAAPRILHHVQDDMQECAAILQARGCAVEASVGPGNHMSFVNERFEAGLSALEAFLGAKGDTPARHPL